MTNRISELFYIQEKLKTALIYQLLKIKQYHYQKLILITKNQQIQRQVIKNITFTKFDL